jgi:hypothetical protein
MEADTVDRKVSSTIKNGHSNYFVIACDDERAEKPKNLLLHRLTDSELVIANDVIWLNYSEVYWSRGNYLGRNLISAVSEFFDTFTGSDIKDMLESVLESSKSAREAYYFLIGCMSSKFRNDNEISVILEQLGNLQY